MNANPTATPVLFLLSSAGSAGPMTPAVTLGQGLPTQHNGLPIHYRWGDGVKIGEKYTHPTKGYVVDASASNVGKLEKNFAAMKKRGVKVPIVKDHSLKADDAMGAVYDVRRKDGWFQPLLGFYGDDSLNTGLKNEISLGIKPKFTDGQGNDYDFAMEHVAATPIPVVNDQRGLLAASRGEDGERPVLLLSSAAKTPERSSSMALKPEHRKEMLAMLSGAGAKDDMPDDDLMSMHIDHAGKMYRDLSKLKTHHVNLSTQNDQLIEAIGTAQKTIESLNLSRASAVPSTDPEVLHERQLRISANGNRLIGRYTPADTKKILTVIAGEPGSPNVYTLSRGEGETDCLAAKLIDVLLECGPAPKPGDVAGPMLLSRVLDHTAASQTAIGDGGTRAVASPYTNAEVKIPAA